MLLLVLVLQLRLIFEILIFNLIFYEKRIMHAQFDNEWKKENSKFGLVEREFFFVYEYAYIQ